MLIDLNGWSSPERPPDTDRVVLLVREAAIGVGVWRDIGYYREGVWNSVGAKCLLHNVLAWMEYPEMPKMKLS